MSNGTDSLRDGLRSVPVWSLKYGSSQKAACKQSLPQVGAKAVFQTAAEAGSEIPINVPSVCRQESGESKGKGSLTVQTDQVCTGRCPKPACLGTCKDPSLWLLLAQLFYGSVVQHDAAARAPANAQ